MIKPIETIYRSYRFRSRLEARWAVFFDALGIAWAYEPQGFELPSGTRYLPDFHLPEQGYWIDIKPRTTPQYERRATFAKLDEIAAYFNDSAAAVLCGEPYAYAAAPRGDFAAYEVEAADYPFLFAECPICGFIGLAYEGWATRIRCACGHDDASRWHKVFCAATPRLMRAYETARQARFEYGETPVIYNPKAIC